MELKTASALAERLVTQMTPYCKRVEIAGSIRRGKSEVKDIEIVAIPCWGEVKSGGTLFAELEKAPPLNQLHVWALQAVARGELVWIKPGTSVIEFWTPKAEGKYWRGLLAHEGEQIKLDLFLTKPENFGSVFLIRTGSADFSRAVAAHAQHIHHPFKDGFLTIAGVPVETFEEAHVFELLGLQFVEPNRRIDGRAVRKVEIQGR